MMPSVIIGLSINPELKQHFKDEGHSIFWQDTVPDILSLLESLSKSVQLILIDYQFPNLELDSLVQTLRQESFIPEIVVISIHDIPYDTYISVLKLGIYDCFSLDAYENTTAILDRALFRSNTFQKLQDMLEKTYINNSTKRLELAREFVELRQKETAAITEMEFQALFPVHESAMTSNPTFSILEPMVKPLDTKPTVLVVEDEEKVQQVIKRFLMLQGYSALLCGHPHDALTILNNNTAIDIVILDIGLPDMDGIELLKKIKENHREIEVVMLTGYNDRTKIRQSFKAFAFDYIIKPFQKEAFATILSKALQRRLLNRLLKQNPSLFAHDFSTQTRCRILQDIAEKRIKQGQPFLMEDIYILFPELLHSQQSAQLKIPVKKIEEGLLFFIEHLKQETA